MVSSVFVKKITICHKFVKGFEKNIIELSTRVSITLGVTLEVTSTESST